MNTINLRQKYSVITLLMLVLGITNSKAQLNITTSVNAATLASSLAGDGVVITNPKLTCPQGAYGSFSGTSSLGLTGGIVLTTGKAKTVGTAYGVNGSSSLLASNNNNAAGDAQLNSLAGKPTVDACALEFDVTAAGEDLSFSYVFGSEQYAYTTCAPYNDAFAFFISGPGINGTENMAMVPGTSIPVGINSINGGTASTGYPLSNCNNMGTGSPFTNYYVNNASGSSITYRGHTSILTAAHHVEPCQTYHIKIAIADADTAAYDSGIFMKAKTLYTVRNNIKATFPNSSQDVIIKGCAPAKLTFTRSKAEPFAQTVDLDISGSAANGYDYATIPTSITFPAFDSVVTLNIQGLATPVEDPKDLTISIKSYNCSANTNTVKTTIKLQSAGIITRNTAICLGSSLQLRATTNSAFTYRWTPDSAFNATTIPDPTITPLVDGTYYLTLGIPSSFGCQNTRYSVDVSVDEYPTPSFIAPKKICSGDSAELWDTTEPIYPGYFYEWYGPGGFSSTEQNPVFLANDSSQGDYYLTLRTDTSYCRSIVSHFIEVTVTPPPPIATPQTLCIGSPERISANVISSILWYTSDSGGVGVAEPPSISTATVNQYRFYATDNLLGCESVRKPIDIHIINCCVGIITIPNAFTPNGDGKNDIFSPKMSPEYSIDNFRVFNRWGESIFFSSSADIGWNGEYLGRAMDAGTYFYEIEFACINGSKERRNGTVTLLR